MAYVKNKQMAYVKNKVKRFIFKHECLYTAYADDTTIFFKDRKSTIELMS